MLTLLRLLNSLKIRPYVEIAPCVDFFQFFYKARWSVCDFFDFKIFGTAIRGKKKLIVASMLDKQSLRLRISVLIPSFIIIIYIHILLLKNQAFDRSNRMYELPMYV